MEDFPCHSSEKVKLFEVELKADLTELKAELEDNDIIRGSGKAISSVSIPKDERHFARERELAIKSALKVTEAIPLVVQADVMSRELQTTQMSDYSAESLPLLLHQHFCDRIHQLVRCKHLHLLRWKRFLHHTSTIEALHPLYTQRLEQIMSEYSDCIQRAQRLSVAREALLAFDHQGALLSVKIEDLLIYLRWLVSHFASVRKFHQYLRVLEWLPIRHQNDIDTGTTEDLGTVNLDMEICGVDSRQRSASSKIRPTTSTSSASLRPSTVPLSASRAASVGRCAEKEKECVPLHTSDLSDIQSQIEIMLNLYGIEADVSTLSLSADEMELLAKVLSKFRTIFQRQEHMRTFRTYDYVEAVGVRPGWESAAEGGSHAYKKESNWTSFISLRAEHDLVQERCLVQLRTKNNVDPLLKAQFNFIKVSSVEKVQDALRDHAAAVREPIVIQPINLGSTNGIGVSNRRALQSHRVEDVTAVWQKIYNNPELHKKDDDFEFELLSSNKKDVSSSSVGRLPHSAYGSRGENKRKNSFDYFNAIQLLGLEEGEQDRTDPASIQGAYMSFLHLRHLRIRDLHRTCLMDIVHGLQLRRHSERLLAGKLKRNRNANILPDRRPSAALNFTSKLHRIHLTAFSCLSVLNYFRSIERTLTINDAGLVSDNSDVFIQKCKQNHHRSVIDGGQCSGGTGLGSHQYLHYTPADYVLNETEFMEFCEVDNHDDYYSLDADGRVHVQDQRGCYVVYEAALDDLERLEQDLLLVATHFIEQDKKSRSGSAVAKRRQRPFNTAQHSSDDLDISSYGHQEVDRFAVILDIWSNEAAYLERKKQLLDCYVEAYQHVFDRDARHELAQVITDISHRRPRFDFSDADYFVKNYQLECSCLELQTKLVQDLLSTQIQEERNRIGKICRGSDVVQQFGMPHPIIERQPVALNMSRSSLKNVFLLEFHPSMAVASQIARALKHAYSELYNGHSPSTVTESIILEREMLKFALSDWNSMPHMGASFSAQVQHDVFSTVYMDDPMLVCDLAQTLLVQSEQTGQKKKSIKDRQEAMLTGIGQVLDLVTTRHRLLDTIWQSEVLAKIYRRQGVAMGFEEFHVFMRLVQFEFAKIKSDAGKPPPVFITALQEDDSRIDRYAPNTMVLAVQELDESHVGKFCLRSKESTLQILKEKGIECIRVALAVQTVHKNALLCAIQQASVCQQIKEVVCKPRPSSSSLVVPGEMDLFGGGGGGGGVGGWKGVRAWSRRSSDTPTGSLLSVNQGQPSMGQPEDSRCSEAFVSIQLEKVPCRDLMLNEYLVFKEDNPIMFKTVSDVEKTKRRFIMTFCERFSCRMAQYSLRAQLIAYYSSIKQLLNDFHTIREKFFVVGTPVDSKSGQDGGGGGGGGGLGVGGGGGEEFSLTVQHDVRDGRKRVCAVLSNDIKRVLNVWYIPHHTESLVLYKTRSDVDCRSALAKHLIIAAGLHDILQYLCAYARLGSTQFSALTTTDCLPADWGGIDGIGAELQEIQRQLDSLPAGVDVDTVGRFLTMRRDVMFQVFDASVRYAVRDTFLAMSNQKAFESVTECMHHSLHALGNVCKPSCLSTYLNIPQPLEPGDSQTLRLYPWRDFINSNDTYPIHFWNWQQMSYNMQLCLASLNDSDKQVANAEILNMSLLLEDVLESGQLDKSMFFANDPVEPVDSKKKSTNVRRASFLVPGADMSRRSSLRSHNKDFNRSLSQVSEPLLAYPILKSFLVLWKRLELFKHNWGALRLGVDSINTPELYTAYCAEYRHEVLLPVLQNIAMLNNQPDLYDARSADLEVIVLPKGVSETEARTRQLVKMVERFEVHMIFEVKKKLQKALTLAVAERAREENALPTDLWKQPVIKESFTMGLPHVVEKFVSQLMSDHEEGGGGIDMVGGKEGVVNRVTFTSDHINNCLQQLATNIMEREKHTYENYSTYYENMLKANHRLLYHKEREVVNLKNELRALQSSVQVEVQCQLADTMQDTLLEVAALRTKLTEMKEQSTRQEKEIEDRVRENYNDLVESLVQMIHEQTQRFSEFRRTLSDDVLQKIAQTRIEANEAMQRLALKTGVTADAELARRSQVTSHQIRQLQEENHQLTQLVSKLRAMNKWRIYTDERRHEQLSCKLRKLAEASGKERVREMMSTEQKMKMTTDEMSAVRTALKTSQIECELIKKDLEKELKEKLDKNHISQQKALSLKQLEEARIAKIKKLCADLEDNKGKVLMLAEEKERYRQQQQIEIEKTRRDAEQIKKKLEKERLLKLSAFQTVSQLRLQANESELVFQPSRPNTAVSGQHVGLHSRLYSADVPKSSSGQEATPTAASRLVAGEYNQPVAALTWTGLRCQSATGDMRAHVTTASSVMEQYKKMRRPKTTNARLRTRLAEQILSDLDPPDHHEILVRIKSASMNLRTAAQTNNAE